MLSGQRWLNLMNKSTDLSIIIVNFNTEFFLSKCLKSILAADKNTYNIEVITIDNASTDGSKEMLKKLKMQNLKVIFNEKNLGFAAANNVGIKNSQGRYILLLNSDTELSKESLNQMIKFMDDHLEAGAATARLDLSSGQMDPACHRGFPTPWAALTYFSGLEQLFPKSRILGEYHLGYKDLAKPHQIDSPSGAFFMVRKDVIAKVGLLDEDYFMYGEDLDWAYRMREAGYQIWFNPEVTVLHHKKQSGRESEDEVVRKQTRQSFFRTMELFYRKHYAKRYGWLVTGFVLLGIKIRSMI